MLYLDYWDECNFRSCGNGNKYNFVNARVTLPLQTIHHALTTTGFVMGFLIVPMEKMK